MMRTPGAVEPIDTPSEIDLRGISAALKRRRRAIVMPTLLAFMGVAIFVNVVSPRYTAESQVLLENQETSFTRPDRVNAQPEQPNQLDPEAVASQVQLISSRDIARRAIELLHLKGNPEFDPVAGGINPLTQTLILLGVVPDPTRESVDSRIVTKFLDKLTVYSPPKTRVIAIQFTSRDRDLAARAANTIAQLYLQEQSAAKRATARVSADVLADQISDLRTKLVAADDALEKYRVESGLLAGSNNMTISGQQLADINSDLSKARSAQADAQAKASLIRELIRSGRAADVTDVINNDTVRRVAEQRVQAQAQLARESRTLLPGHPRIKELTAQLTEYDLALKMVARQAAVSLENEAKIAGQRVANLEAVLTQQKKQAGVANVDEVHLRALERVSQSYKDQLESTTTKYQEALARQASTATPADARIISSAAPPQEASFPKKVPFILFGTFATLVLSIGFVVAGELLGSSVPERDHVYVARETMPSTPSSQTAASVGKPQDPAGLAASDPVFAPVERAHRRASADKLGMLATGGMLAATLSYMKTFGRSAAASRQEEIDPVLPPAETAGDTTPDMTTPYGRRLGTLLSPANSSAVEAEATNADLSGLAGTIIAAHVPGRGLHIVGTGVGDDSKPDMLIGLGRTLSGKGRAIIVDLNRMPTNLSGLVAPDGTGRTKIMSMHGLAELLSGDATFAEVINRDQGSRLHFIPAGLQEADFRDFDLILDALSETYDFIILLTPAFPHSEIAKIMAPYADFVVLAAPKAGSADQIVAECQREMVQAGAREVLIAGADGRSGQEVA